MTSSHTSSLASPSSRAIARVYSAIPAGYTGQIIEVEGDKSRGLPTFNIVGMANKTVSEARERVHSGIISSGFTFPNLKLTINLAPADLHKDGTHLDLAIALNILILSGELRQVDLSHTLFAGELSLSGHLRPIRGIINIVEAAKQAGFKTVILPYHNFTQASLISNIQLLPARSLSEVFAHLKHQQPLQPPHPNVVKNTKTDENPPFLDHIQSQALAKRALTIAIAGHHNFLISGPPGAGKTLLAKTAVNLLPPPTPTEQIQITKLHSLAGLSTDQIIATRPFRSPHHSSSLTAFTGGGPHATPGEVSLAHLGVLFLDELPEYPRHILESLRQPLEDKVITISRANQTARYPTNFMLIATMNPCPCGYLGDPTHECTCTEHQIQTYRHKLSGPLLDRIDLRLIAQAIPNSQLLHSSISPAHPKHDVVKNTITEAINLQHARYAPSLIYNSDLTAQQISTYCPLSPSAQNLLQQASTHYQLSARSYLKVIKVARTIADLEHITLLSETHVAEALAYRQISS